MIRRPPRSTQNRSSAASDVYKRQVVNGAKDAAEQQGVKLDVQFGEEDQKNQLGILETGIANGVSGIAVNVADDDAYDKLLCDAAAKGLSLIHIYEPTRPYSISSAVFCLKKNKKTVLDIVSTLHFEKTTQYHPYTQQTHPTKSTHHHIPHVPLLCQT